MGLAILLWLSVNQSSWLHARSHGLAEERVPSPNSGAVGMHGPVPSKEACCLNISPCPNLCDLPRGKEEKNMVSYDFLHLEKRESEVTLK